ncbi:MAG: hypothetical protein IPL52_14565 [Flavobacteriales bacterium]|nr:hypothetical protein [Flavobacteriales bacterium]
MNTRTHRSALRSVIAIALLVLVTGLRAQVLIGTDGGTTVLPNNTISWSIGEPIIGTGTTPGGIITQGFQQPNIVKVRINIAAFLEGSYIAASGLMSDALRSNGMVPLSEPYTSLGYVFTGGGGETTTTMVLAATGNDAIVDWVVVELRDPNDPTIILASRSALVQRDGDVVDLDGTSAVSIAKATGNYHVAIHHRNHLGAMTFAPLALSGTPTTLDLRVPATATYGTNARKNISGVEVLWAGDVNNDGTLKYTGANNDRDPILVEVGGTVPTATTTGYMAEDVNMDGIVKYVGQNNDRDPILVNIGGTVPTNVRTEQIP